MVQHCLAASVAALALAWCAPPAAAGDDGAEQVRRLGKGQPKADRLTAAKRLAELGAKADAATALPALAACLDDPDADVRREALAALAIIAFHHKQACPLGVAQGLLDPDGGVRSMAWNYVQAFDRFPIEAVPVLLRALRHAEPEVRAAVPLALAAVAGNDRWMRAVLRRATADPDALVRHNAFVALWKMTGDLAVIVPHWVAVLDHSRHGKGARPDKERERVAMNLIVLSAATYLTELGKERPAELGTVLLKLLADPAPAVRRGSAHAVGALADAGMKARAALRDLGAEAALHRLGEDADPMVRDAAREALRKVGG